MTTVPIMRTHPELPPSVHDALAALTQLTARLAGASSCSIHQGSSDVPELDTPAGESVLQYFLAPPAGVGNGGRGVLICVFESRARAEAARAAVDRLAESIRALWAAGHEFNRYSELAARAADLEAQVVASKVTARAIGLLRESPSADSVDVISRHVEMVLQSSSGLRTLNHLVETLEAEKRDRQWTDRAKAILQRQGISEEQAYLHLRRASRTSRRPIPEIARQIIEADAQRERSA